jgi:NAD(P)H-hydrate epimerase
MRAFDQHAIDVCRVPSLVLMENAGRSAADLIEPYLHGNSSCVLVVCGSGNNGGDGFVVARHLAARGVDVSVALVASRETIAGDARKNLDAFIGVGGRVADFTFPTSLGSLGEALGRADAVVDAVFGTGLDRPVSGDLAEVIAAVNRRDAFCVALDIPSGLDADTGSTLGVAVHADVTVTFGHYKLGLLTPEGARLAGRVVIAGLGVPDVSILANVGHAAEVIQADDVGASFVRREPTTYKHEAGNVLLLAGSGGKVGASLLAATAALRAGAGLATIATWPDAADALASRVVEIMTIALDPTRLTESLDAALARRTAVLVGPGFGTDGRARAAVDHVVLGWEGIKIVDADAITLFAGRVAELATAKGQNILTPHAGELARLLGTTADEVERDRFAAAREATRRAGAIVVLKGARTLIAVPDGRMFLCLAGNPSLATAGAGDVLAGIMSAFGCCMTPVRAARAAVLVHGMAADLWASRTASDRGLLASEISENVPHVLAELKGNSSVRGRTKI